MAAEYVDVMSESEREKLTAEGTREVPTIDPRKEPEYVGAHSALAAEHCQNWIGETTDDVEQCGREATHTVVMYHGRISEIAMCDRCGEPEDVDNHERKWTGEVQD